MISSLQFGTSGLRGLAVELDGPPAYRWASAFWRLLLVHGELSVGDSVYIGRDHRSSSQRIASWVGSAAFDLKLRPIDCGTIPTPALAHYAISLKRPAIMVTGSHVPEDRNGLKFYKSSGEIDKADEAAINLQYDDEQITKINLAIETDDRAAILAYMQRYVDAFSSGSLSGLAVGVYQHSSVARDILPRILKALGAKVVTFDRSEEFIAVDTEALDVSTVALLRQRALEHHLDAIVSTDGDADRPLIADSSGNFVRGDMIGALTALRLNVQTVVTPITSNSALEQNALFRDVRRTRIGSPYVIEAMNDAMKQGMVTALGFEANGGVLFYRKQPHDGLQTLLTRDAMLPILAVLAMVAERKVPLADLVASIRFCSARSGRLQEVPSRAMQRFLAGVLDKPEDATALFSAAGRISVDTIDGVRLVSDIGESIHFRASGNAPELRCYIEAHTGEAGDKLLARCLDFARDHL